MRPKPIYVPLIRAKIAEIFSVPIEQLHGPAERWHKPETRKARRVLVVILEELGASIGEISNAMGLAHHKRVTVDPECPVCGMNEANGRSK